MHLKMKLSLLVVCMLGAAIAKPLEDSDDVEMAMKMMSLLKRVFTPDVEQEPQQPAQHSWLNTRQVEGSIAPPPETVEQFIDRECTTSFTDLSGSSTGAIESAGYPQNYSNSASDCWAIGQTGQTTVLSFSDFDIEDSDQCRYDFVSVYFEESDTYGELQMCGFTAPSDITFTGEALILFRSDSSVVYDGFSASFATSATRRAQRKHAWLDRLAKDAQQSVLPDEDIDAFIGYTCLTSLVDQSSSTTGTISTNGQYADNLDDCWIIGTEGATTTITFNTFGVEDTNNCAFDYLAVYFEDNRHAYGTARLCGEKIPSTISFDGEALIHLHTDSSVSLAGVDLSYSTGGAAAKKQAKKGKKTDLVKELQKVLKRNNA